MEAFSSLKLKTLGARENIFASVRKYPSYGMDSNTWNAAEDKPR